MNQTLQDLCKNVSVRKVCWREKTQKRARVSWIEVHAMTRTSFTWTLGRGLTYVEGAHVLRTSQISRGENTWISQQLLWIPRKPPCRGCVCVTLELLIIHAQYAVDRASILRACVSRTSHVFPRKLWNRKAREFICKRNNTTLSTVHPFIDSQQTKLSDGSWMQ